MAKSITGVVSSNKADKTIVVTVRERKTHPLYRKQYTTNTKFMAHDEKNEANVGDKVVIVEHRPISKQKHFILQAVVDKAEVKHVEAAVPVPGAVKDDTTKSSPAKAKLHAEKTETVVSSTDKEKK